MSVVFPPEFTVKVMSEDETVMTSAKASHLTMRLLPKSMASDSVKPITLIPDVKKKGVTEGKFLFTYVALFLLVLVDLITYHKSSVLYVIKQHSSISLDYWQAQVSRHSSSLSRNRESPFSNPPFATFSKIGHFRSSPWQPCWLSCINDYLAIDNGGNVSA